MRQMLREATLGEYEILKELGRGGMATVFLAHDISLDRRVAIKVMASHLLEGEGMAERFKLEARTAAKLSHPNIIPIYAVKESGSTLFFVMKLVEGKELGDIMRTIGPLPIPMVRDILTKVGGALGYAHRRDVVHRDIKPANIMIDEDGTPIVTDYGIAKVATATGLTMTGTTIGTPSYMSPEQCEAREVTGASDQYALGIMAFQMLTGKLPFEGDSAVTIMYKHVNEDLPSLADFRPDCPPDVIETVTRMVAKDPADRWPSLEAAVQKLGTDPTHSYDPIHSQLVQAAKDGDMELVAQLSTGRQTVGGTSGPQVGGGSSARKRAPALIGAAVLAVVVAGSLGVVRPWEADSPPVLAENAGEGAGTAAQGPDGTGPEGSPDDGNPAGFNDGAEGDDRAEGDDGAASGPEPVSGGNDGDRSTDESSDPPPTQPTATTRRVVGTVRVGAAPAMEPGDEVALTVTVRDETGTAIPESVISSCQAHGWSRCGYAWGTSDETVAVVGPGGRVTAVSPGEATVRVTVGGVEGTQTVTVTAASVSEVDVDPGALSLTVGESGVLTARILDRSGRVLADRSITWRSDDPTIASVSPGGEVDAVGPGSATIRATSGSVTSTVAVDVAAAPVDTRTAIGELVAAYGRALESRDVNQVRRAYPGLTSDQEEALAGSLPAMEDLVVVLTIDSFEEDGDVATARVSATYSFVSDGRSQEFPVALSAVFSRVADGWQLTEMR